MTASTSVSTTGSVVTVMTGTVVSSSTVSVTGHGARAAHAAREQVIRDLPAVRAEARLSRIGLVQSQA